MGTVGFGLQCAYDITSLQTIPTSEQDQQGLYLLKCKFSGAKTRQEGQSLPVLASKPVRKQHSDTLKPNLDRFSVHTTSETCFLYFSWSSLLNQSILSVLWHANKCALTEISWFEKSIFFSHFTGISLIIGNTANLQSCLLTKWQLQVS